MLWIGQHGFLGLGRPSPQDEYHGTVLLIEDPDGGVRKLLPPNIMVRIGLVGTHGQYGVKEHDALVRPLLQISVIGDVTPQVVVKLLIYIHQGRRDLHIRLYGKNTGRGPVRHCDKGPAPG